MNGMMMKSGWFRVITTALCCVLVLATAAGCVLGDDYETLRAKAFGINNAPDGNVTINSIFIDTDDAVIDEDGALQGYVDKEYYFYAEVETNPVKDDEDPSHAVTWSLEGGNGESYIDEVEGILYIDAEESPSTTPYNNKNKSTWLIITATSFDGKVTATVRVQVMAGDPGTGVNTAIEMVWVPGGSFEMGDANYDNYDYSRPVHTVTLTGFYMGKYEVTQAQYQAVMGNNPSYFSSSPATRETQNKRPVEEVTWDKAVEFCNKLSEREGLTRAYTISGTNVTWNRNATGYRLPTEAQWEYAAKGGNGSPGNYTYSGSNSVNEVAWYGNNSGSKTHEVGKKAPNGLGIYDMSGNVYEWCWDWYGDYSSETQTNPTGASSGSYRVLRGGNWSTSAGNVRSAIRDRAIPNAQSIYWGFRLARNNN